MTLLADRRRPRASQLSASTGSGVPSAADGTEAVRSTSAKAWWTVVGITLVFWAFQLFGYVDARPWLSLMVVVLGAWGLATVAASWQPVVASPKLAETLAWITVALTLVAFGVWSYLQIVGAPAYGTDEIAFDQYAAQLALHGANPYVHSMAPAFSLFHVSPDGYTWSLSGRPITSLSYPALSFLLYVPMLWLGWSSQMAVAVNVAAWGLGIVLAFALLPRQARPLALVVGSLSVYIAYAVGGVTDALFVPLLIGAVYRWDRFPSTKGPAAWRGPVLLGLAMAVKQTPWLLLPFLAVGVGLEARRLTGSIAGGWRGGARYAGIALGAFLVPNLAFIVLDPHAWVHGVLTPIVSHAVPAGQGVVGLSLFLGVGGGSLSAYTVALVVIFVALWATFVATFPSSKVWAAVAPAVVLFFAGRSYGSYLVTLLPAAAVGAFTVERLPGTGRPGWWKHWRWLVAASLVAAGLSVGAALASSAPFGLTIVSVRTTGQLATVEQVGVRVVNQSSSAQRPAFSVESGGVLTAFWVARRGPGMLGPHHHATYELYAPNFPAQPSISGGFQVVAFTSSPGTVSRSGAYVPTINHVNLVPDAVNQVVPVGRKVTVHAEVLDSLNRPVRQAGLPVYLGQVIYAQHGLQYSEAVINDGQVGQTPVVAYTDDQGVATFTIRGTQSSLTPVYFEANLVNASQFYPYGYSQILPIRFDG